MMLDRRSLLIGSSTILSGAAWARGSPVQAHPDGLTFVWTNSFWINLDSFLYEEAVPATDRSKRPLDLLRKPRTALNEADQADLAQAVSYYRDRVVPAGRESEATRTALVALSSTADNRALDPIRIGEPRAAVLNQVAGLYRREWWAAHRTANQMWINEAVSLVGIFGEEMSQYLSSAFGTSWPVKPHAMNVTVYGNWYGAYTLTDPGYTLMPSSDPNYRGPAALEMIYHEAAHNIVFPHEGRIGQALVQAGAAQGRTVPRDLWHVLIFVTAQWAARVCFAKVGLRYDSPSDHAGLWDNGGDWTRLHDAADLYWGRHLEGKLGIEEAIAMLVQATGEPPHAGA